MIGWVMEGQQSGGTAGPDDCRLDKVGRGDLVVLLEAVLAPMGCVVHVGAIVAACKAENGIGYVRLHAVFEGKAA